jgi:hypothetical protein
VSLKTEKKSFTAMSKKPVSATPVLKVGVVVK